MTVTTDREVELEGRRYVCTKRDDGGAVEYTFDMGASWRATMLEAYTVAKEAGRLAAVGDLGQAGEFEAWLLALVGEIRSLEHGEQLRVSKSGGVLVVTRDKVVLTCRADAVVEEDDGGQGGAGVHGGADPRGGGRDGERPGRGDDPLEP